jgi:hypothetical protein
MDHFALAPARMPSDDHSTDHSVAALGVAASTSNGSLSDSLAATDALAPAGTLEATALVAPASADHTGSASASGSKSDGSGTDSACGCAGTGSDSVIATADGTCIIDTGSARACATTDTRYSDGCGEAAIASSPALYVFPNWHCLSFPLHAFHCEHIIIKHWHWTLPLGGSGTVDHCSRISVVSMAGAALAIDDASAAETIRNVKKRVFAANPQMSVRRQRLMYTDGPYGITPLADDETLGGAGVARDGSAKLDVLLVDLTAAEVAALGKKVLFHS